MLFSQVYFGGLMLVYWAITFQITLYFIIPLLVPLFMTCIHDTVSAFLINTSIVVTGQVRPVIKDIKKSKI